MKYLTIYIGVFLFFQWFPIIGSSFIWFKPMSLATFLIKREKAIEKRKNLKLV